MSALAVDEVLDSRVALRVAAQAQQGWVHVPRSSAAGSESLATVTPLPRVVSRPTPAAQPRLQLTERGLAVIIGTFLSLCLIAVVVAVTSFLSVSNEPPAGVQVAVAATTGH